MYFACTHVEVRRRRRIVYPRAAVYSAVSRRTSTQDAADAILCYRNLLQHSAQIEHLYSMLHPSTYDDAVCVNVLDYNIAVRQGTVPGA